MARNRKAKNYGSLASQQAPDALTSIEATRNDALPALDPWIEGDLKLQQLAKRIETDYLDFCELAKTAMQEQWHTRFGFVDARDYFEQRIGLSYRTLRRRFTILEAIEKLPAAEQAEARAAMVELGSHKAAALAPILEEAPGEWRKAAEFAKTATEDAVQSMVSERLGAPHRGLPAQEHPGSRFLRQILNQVPPEEHDRTEWVFRELSKIAGSVNAVSIFLVLVNLGEQELAAVGVYREKEKKA